MPTHAAYHLLWYAVICWLAVNGLALDPLYMSVLACCPNIAEHDTQHDGHPKHATCCPTATNRLQVLDREHEQARVCSRMPVR